MRSGPWRWRAGQERARGTRAALCATVAVIGSLLAIGPPAHAAAVYPLFGAGAAPARSGAVAAEVFLGLPKRVAVRGDGLMAVTDDNEVYLIRAGRLRRAAMPTAVTSLYPELTMTFAPDGALLVGTCPESQPTAPAAVFRVDETGAVTRVAGQLRAHGTSGDGGAASAARFECVAALAVAGDGTVLIADPAAGRVRRIAPDGVVSTVAGTGRDVSAGDGGPAVAASFTIAASVAALPDGGIAILDRRIQRHTQVGMDRVRVVAPSGVISTRARVIATDLWATPDGSLLSVDEFGPPVVRRLSPTGLKEVAVDLRTDIVGITPWIPVAGDPFGGSADVVTAAVPTPDGGMLLGGRSVLYVPPAVPAVPAVLAVALSGSTRAVRPGVETHLTSTLAARVTAEVWRYRGGRGRVVARATADVPGGDAVIPVRSTLAPGLYDLRVRAEAGGQVAVATANLLVGGLLPIRFAKDFVASRGELFETFAGAVPIALQCRRVTARIVDCGMRSEGRCAGVARVRILPDGTLSVAQYDGGGRRCRFRSTGGREQ